MAILKHRVILEWPGPGSPGVNTWHGEFDEALASSPQAQVDALRDFYANFTGAFVAGMKVTHDGLPFAVDTLEEFPVTGWTQTSIATQLALPSASMMCISWKSDIRARRGMGRTFLGPLTRDTDQGNGTILDSFRTGSLSAANALVAASEGFIGNALGIYGYTNAKPKGLPRNPEDPKTFRPFKGASINDQYAVLRSRRD